MPTTGRSYQYDFEISEESVRTIKQAQKEADLFLKRVKSEIHFKDLDDHNKISITEFMIASVLNIEWYQKNMKKQKKYFWLYSFIAFGLLLILPIVLSFFPVQALSTQHPVQAVSAQSQGLGFASSLVAILSSIIAFYKAFSEWFRKRLRIGEFWRASSRIKEILYRLEGEYYGLATRDGNLTEDFKRAVFEATAACRKVASDEQQKFFDQETLPDFELGKALASARTEAISLISYNAPAAIKPDKVFKM